MPPWGGKLWTLCPLCVLLPPDYQPPPHRPSPLPPVEATVVVLGGEVVAVVEAEVAVVNLAAGPLLDLLWGGCAWWGGGGFWFGAFACGGRRRGGRGGFSRGEGQHTWQQRIRLEVEICRGVEKVHSHADRWRVFIFLVRRTPLQGLLVDWKEVGNL